MDELSTDSQAQSAAIPSPQELVSRATAMIPALRDRAAACEENRRVADETIEEMRAAGLFSVSKTKAYGGYEMGWDVLCEIAMELGKGCGSSAWVFAVLAEHNQTVGTYPLEAQADIWGENPDVMVASGNSPNAQLEETDGGWLLTTQFNFSSGCDFADWHLTGMPVDGKVMKILVPQDDCEIVDNWHVMGLKGTGSKDIKMSKVFLPHHRTIGIMEKGPRFDESPLFRMPQWSVNPYGLVSVCIGVAEGALERFVDDMKTRSSRFGAKIADYQSLQLRIAESAAELHAARLMVLENLRETMDWLEDNEQMPIEMMARNKRDMAYAPNLAIKAIDRIMYAAGANGLFLSSHVQRAFRDVHSGIGQIALNWDINGTTYGKVALGLDPAPVRW